MLESGTQLSVDKELNIEKDFPVSLVHVKTVERNTKTHQFNEREGERETQIKTNDSIRKLL